MRNFYKIRIANQQDIPFLARTIAQAYKDVAQRFGLTPQSCPKHPSNCTGKWVQSDLDRGVIYYVLERDQDICGFVESETKSFDHLPFAVTFLAMNN